MEKRKFCSVEEKSIDKDIYHLDKKSKIKNTEHDKHEISFLCATRAENRIKRK